MNLRRTALALGLVLVMVIGTLTGCGSQKLDGTKTALTVNGESVSAGTLSLMANYDAALMYTYYGTYMGSDYFDLAAGDDEEEETSEEENAEAEEDAEAEDAAEETDAESEETEAEDTEAAEEETDDEKKEDGPTIGDHMVKEAADELAELVVISQHAEEYGVALTDEEKAAIDEAAQKYVDANPADVLKKLGTSKEDMVTLLTLETIKSKMLPEIAKSVDTNIDDDEAQQSSATILTISYKDDTEEAADDASEDETEENTTPTKEQAVADLQKILDEIEKSDDPAGCDISAIAGEINEDYSAASSSWTTNDPDQTSISAVLYEAAKDLKDGEVCRDVIIDEDNLECSILRMDKVFDEESTESQKGYIYYQRETDNLDELVKEWVDASDIVKDEKVISTVKITGSQLYTLKAEETEETESEEEHDHEHEDGESAEEGSEEADAE